MCLNVQCASHQLPRELPRKKEPIEFITEGTHRVYCSVRDEIKRMDLSDHLAGEICPVCQNEKGEKPGQCNFEISLN